eukprot:5065353-Pleurochrysis_carterae.AAC.3
MPFNSRSKSATSAKKMRTNVALAVASMSCQNELQVVGCSRTVAAEDPASLGCVVQESRRF